ncbi:MAG: base excision DNA repair protein [Acidobacteriaceae bacterium]
MMKTENRHIAEQHYYSAVDAMADGDLPAVIEQFRASIAADSSPNRRLRVLYAALLETYGARRWWPADTPFEVVLGAFLTQATAWRSVERSIANLRAAGLLTIDGIRTIPEEKLRDAIRPSGFVVRKAASIKTFVQFLDEHYGGSLKRMAKQPTAILRPQLLALRGVGQETADAILLYALGHPVFVVDEYFRRVATRHELATANARYAELQTLGDGAVASASTKETARHANELHALVVEVGKRHCGTTPRCEGCPLQPFLPGPSMQNAYTAWARSHARNAK